jgi:alpha-tubulin suppressor-like RCC1 family protein
VAAASVKCVAHDPATATVSADCSTVTPLRVGDVSIDVTGGGAAATLVVAGVPQRQWTGVHGSASSNGGGNYALVGTPVGGLLGWGANPAGVLDRGVDINALPSLAVPTAGLDANGAALAHVAQASAGDTSAGALLDDGSVIGWGDNAFRQLGNAQPLGTVLKPLSVSDATGRGALGHVAQAEFGADNSVALVDDGTVLTWGEYGAAGSYSAGLPAQALDAAGKTLANVAAVSAGAHFTLALTEDGRVLSWGFDLSEGRLGSGTVLGTPVTHAAPVLRADGTALDGIVQVSAGYDFSLALGADGTVWAWGDNEWGQLGQGKVLGNSPVAVRVLGSDGAPLSGIAMVAAGGNHALALDVHGQVLAWGLATDGQLGDGVNRPAGNQVSLPEPVVAATGTGALGGVVSIAAGFTTSFALRGDGTVLSWGEAFRDALGRPTTGPFDAVPGAVSGSAGGTLTLTPSAYPNLLRHAH